MAQQRSLDSFFGGGTFGPDIRRKKLSEEEKRERKRDYEKTGRERKFIPKWCQQFPWLIADSSGMFCNVCRSCYGPLSSFKVPSSYDKYRKGPFVMGCNNQKKDTLVSHSNSRGHISAVEFKEARNKAPGQSEAEKVYQKLNEKALKKLKPLFQDCHAIVKHSRPFKDYLWHRKLHEKMGLDVANAYTSDKSAADFTNATAQNELLKIASQIEAAPFLSVLSDGSTDISVHENEIVYVRYAHKGVTKTVFLKLVHVKRANAEGIYSALCSALESIPNTSSVEIWKKVIAFGCDGASVNTGLKNGVISLLHRRVSKSIVMVHCMAHRLELAFKSVNLYANVMTMLQSAYTFYKGYLQRGLLKDAFVSLGISAIMPTRIGGTRWVGHTLTALQNFWKGYPAIVKHLSETCDLYSTADSRAKSSAQNLLKLCTSRQVIVFAHFLNDVLNSLSKLSAEIQKRDITLHECSQHVNSAVIAIEQMKQRPGFNLRSIIDCDSFHSQSLKGNILQMTTVHKVIDQVTMCLKERYGDLDGTLLRGTSLSDLKTWPEQNITGFGSEKVSVLVDHFRDHLLIAGVELGHVDHEWAALKNMLYTSHNPRQMTWQEIWELFGEQCTNILTLMDLVLSLPASTAECERGFSQLKIIKTELRNQLKPSTVSLLLTVQLNTGDIDEYDPTDAIHWWLRMKPRRCGRLTATDQQTGTEFDVKLTDSVQENDVQGAEDKDCVSSDDSCYDSDDYQCDSDTSDMNMFDIDNE